MEECAKLNSAGHLVRKSSLIGVMLRRDRAGGEATENEITDNITISA